MMSKLHMPCMIRAFQPAFINHVPLITIYEQLHGETNDFDQLKNFDH